MTPSLPYLDDALLGLRDQPAAQLLLHLGVEDFLQRSLQGLAALNVPLLNQVTELVLREKGNSRLSPASSEDGVWLPVWQCNQTITTVTTIYIFHRHHQIKGRKTGSNPPTPLPPIRIKVCNYQGYAPCSKVVGLPQSRWWHCHRRWRWKTPASRQSPPATAATFPVNHRHITLSCKHRRLPGLNLAGNKAWRRSLLCAGYKHTQMSSWI